MGRLGEERRLGQRRKYIREMKHFKTNRGENTWTSNTLDVLRTCGVNVTSILDEEASSSEEVEELVKIGVYGLPSAGKSTLMNAMAGRKVTSTSATPGHTKHIQTWYVVCPYERSHTLLTLILRVGTCENQTNPLVLRCCVTLQVLSYLDRDILKSYHALTVRRMQLMCCINFSESYVVFDHFYSFTYECQIYHYITGYHTRIRILSNTGTVGTDS